MHKMSTTLRIEEIIYINRLLFIPNNHYHRYIYISDGKYIECSYKFSFNVTTHNF